MAAQKHFFQDNNITKEEKTHTLNYALQNTHAHFSLTDKKPKERI